VREPRRARLFFLQEGGEMVTPVERVISPAPTLADEVRAVLQELAASGLPGVRSPLPPGTELRQVFVDAFGVAYLDFNRGFLDAASAPLIEFESSISAIVNTLTDSFREIKRVQVLAEGQELEVVVGSWDLRRPLLPPAPGLT